MNPMTPPTYQDLVEALRFHLDIEPDFCHLNPDGSCRNHYLGRPCEVAANRALLARAEFAKLVGTYVWHDVATVKPPENEWVYALDAGDEEDVYRVMWKDGAWWYWEDKYGAQRSSWKFDYWRSEVLPPSALKGAK